MATYALMGSRRDTEVSRWTDRTRSPSCPRAIPAIPSVSERTFVNSRLSCAVFTAALERVDRRRSGELGLDVVFELAGGDGPRLPPAEMCARRRGRGQLRIGCAFCPRAWSSAAWNGPRIDLEQHVPLLDVGALDVALLDEVARDLGLDSWRSRSVERATQVMRSGTS